jgi:hypothetical protein
MKPLSTLLLALVCAVSFISLALLTTSAMIEAFGPAQTLGKLVQIVSFHIVAHLVVGLLASKLSQGRTSDEQLQQTTKTLASLRLLH